MTHGYQLRPALCPYTAVYSAPGLLTAFVAFATLAHNFLVAKRMINDVVQSFPQPSLRSESFHD